MWKGAPGYEGLYEVSSCGEVRSCISGKHLAPTFSGRGNQVYVRLWLSGGCKAHLVSRLVLLAFFGPPPVKSWTASHLNGCCQDNRIENLVWESLRDNLARREQHGTLVHGEAAPWSKLSSDDVAYIKASTETQGTLAKKFGVSQPQISKIKRNLQWVRH